MQRYERIHHRNQILTRFLLLLVLLAHALSCLSTQLVSIVWDLDINEWCICSTCQTWHVRVQPWCTFTHQISSGWVYCITLEGWKRPIFRVPYFQHSVMVCHRDSCMWAHNYKPSPIQQYRKHFHVQMSCLIVKLLVQTQKHRQKTLNFSPRPMTEHEVQAALYSAWQ